MASKRQARMCIAAAVLGYPFQARMIGYKAVQMSCGSAAERRACWHAGMSRCMAVHMEADDVASHSIPLPHLRSTELATRKPAVRWNVLRRI